MSKKRVRLRAALPPHSAERLCLSGGCLFSFFEAMPRKRRLSLQEFYSRFRKGTAFPHCAAAKPHARQLQDPVKRTFRAKPLHPAGSRATKKGAGLDRDLPRLVVAS